MSTCGVMTSRIRPVGKVEEGVDDLPFDFLDLAVRVAQFGEGTDVGIGARARIASRTGTRRSRRMPAQWLQRTDAPTGRAPETVARLPGRLRGRSARGTGSRGSLVVSPNTRMTVVTAAVASHGPPLLANEADEERRRHGRSEHIDDVVRHQQR